jgi:hypothetical protein
MKVIRYFLYGMVFLVLVVDIVYGALAIVQVFSGVDVSAVVWLSIGNLFVFSVFLSDDPEDLYQEELEARLKELSLKNNRSKAI